MRLRCGIWNGNVAAQRARREDVEKARDDKSRRRLYLQFATALFYVKCIPRVRLWADIEHEAFLTV